MVPLPFRNVFRHRRNSALLNVQKPVWLIGELNLPFARKDDGGAFGGLDTEQCIAMNPHQVIATILDDAVTVWGAEVVTVFTYPSIKQIRPV